VTRPVTTEPPIPAGQTTDPHTRPRPHLRNAGLRGPTGRRDRYRSGFTDLDGTLPNDVGAVVGGGGWMYVMAVSSNSELYYDELPPNGTWSGWTLVSSTPVTGVPNIIQDAAGTDRVYVRQASNGAMVESTLPTGTSTWSVYDSLGGTLINDAAALGGTGGTVFVFEIGGELTSTTTSFLRVAPTEAGQASPAVSSEFPQSWRNQQAPPTYSPAPQPGHSKWTFCPAGRQHGRRSHPSAGPSRAASHGKGPAGAYEPARTVGALSRVSKL
jgi:hypothetical protein